MKTLTLTVKLTYDDEIMHGGDKVSKRWFFKHVLLDPPKDEPLLSLHSQSIGDEVGTIEVIKIHK